MLRTNRASLGKFTVDEVCSADFVDKYHGDTDKVAQVQLADRSVELPVQLVIMNSFLWPIYRKFDVPITTDRVFFPDRAVDKSTGKATYSFTSETVTRCTNAIYNELSLFHHVQDHMQVLAQVW